MLEPPFLWRQISQGDRVVKFIRKSVGIGSNVQRMAAHRSPRTNTALYERTDDDVAVNARARIFISHFELLIRAQAARRRRWSYA